MVYKFYERVYDDPVRFHCCAGSRIKQLYSPSIDDFGTLDLKPSGVENLYQYIQSFKDSVDLNLIIARYANGDVNALNKYKGFFADVSELPKSYAEFLDVKEKAEDVFNHLSVEDREKFDFDVNKFIASFGTDAFISCFASDRSSVNNEEVKKGVEVSEQKSE